MKPMSHAVSGCRLLESEAAQLYSYKSFTTNLFN